MTQYFYAFCTDLSNPYFLNTVEEVASLLKGKDIKILCNTILKHTILDFGTVAVLLQEYSTV
jgi:hypothetical protein